MRLGRKLLALILFVPPVAFAQAQQPAAPATKPIVFDTVSVKPNKTNDAHRGSMLRPDGFDAENITPIWVLDWAFGRTAQDENYFSGLPGWVSSDRFDIIAKVAGPDVPVWKHMSNAEKQQMIRGVFADRFKLQTHTEAREQLIYALVVAKNGAKLQPARRKVVLAGGDGTAIENAWFGRSASGIVAGNMTLDDFAEHLTALQLGRPVQNHTGIAGLYDFKLDFAPMTSGAEPSAASPATAPDPAPDIFTAIQEQLGLKLEPGKGPVAFLVIDHIERPSEN